MGCRWVAMVAALLSVGGVVTCAEVYDINRTFEPIPYQDGNPSGMKIIQGVKNLTGMITVDPIQVETNYAHEYEGIGIGYNSEAVAWRAAVTGRNFRAYRVAESVANAGMVSLTHPNPYSGWNAYLHVIQNRLLFYPATSHRYVFPEGHTGFVSRVLVGTLGDWVLPESIWHDFFNDPYPIAEHIGPHINWAALTNQPVATDLVATARFDTHYKLRPEFIMSLNDGDCDQDGVIDYADGFNADHIDGNADDECDCRNTTLWSVEIPGYLDPACARLKFAYNFSDPTQLQMTNGVIIPEPGDLRLWTKDANGNRFALHGEYVATDLGLNETNRQLHIEIESVGVPSYWGDFFGLPPPPSIEVNVWGEGDATCSNHLYWAKPGTSYKSGDNSIYFYSGSSDQANVTVINPRLVPDWNHDRVINTSDYNQASISNPFRFWINDDNDESSDAKTGDDVDIPGSPPFDANNDKIDGTRDLIDFFPVFLDLKSTLDVMGTADYRYRIKYQGTGSAGIVLTELYPTNAGEYLVNTTVATSLVEEVDVRRVDGRINSYFTLGTNFLHMIRNDGRGVILVELSNAGSKSLQIEIRNLAGGLVHTADLPLEASGVEDMFNHKNLRVAVNKTGGASDRIEVPRNLPEHHDKDKHFIFVHGFNVNGEEARAWNCEIFKRLYWSGSKARFHGITWYGNQTDIGMTTLNYHINVKNAFEAGALLKLYTDTLTGEVIVAAHSMGNMVVSAAIEDNGMNPSKYLMLNAAVALEAYDQSLQDNPLVGWEEMMHCEWREGSNSQNPPLYERRLWASDWHNLFPSDDARSRLTWANRFPSVLNVAFHFYSSGEDVLENFTGGDGCFYAIEGWFSRGAWVKQEKLKGRTTINVGGSNYGGWGFNELYDGSPVAGYQKPSPDVVSNIPPHVLRIMPFFLPGPSSRDDLYTTLHGSQYAYDNHAELIGGMIPALTYAAGANQIQLLDVLSGEVRNFNMNSLQYQAESWPRRELEWLHSDIVNVSLQYIYKLFNEFVAIGSLDK